MKTTKTCGGLCLLLCLAVSANAQIRDGGFTNNGEGWIATGGGPGAPRLATNGTAIVVQIGTNSAAGVPGVPNGQLEQIDFVPDPLGGTNSAEVAFTDTFVQAPGETAEVTLTSEQGSNTREIPAGDPVQIISLPRSASQGVIIIFTVRSCLPGAPINSLLEISQVSSSSSGLPIDTMTCIPARYGIPWGPMVPLGYNTGATYTGLLNFPFGWTPFGIPVVSGGNLIDSLLPAKTNSMLMIWNGGTWNTYNRVAPGIWTPTGGTLLPGQAAFFFNQGSQPQVFTYFGTLAQLLFLHHLFNGTNVVANSQSGPESLQEVLGTPPEVGDIVKFYTSTASAPLIPTWTYNVNTLTEENLPLVTNGVVQIIYTNPITVPLVALPPGNGFGTNGITIRAPGGLPDGILQESSDLASNIWKNLYGVGSYMRFDEGGRHYQTVFDVEYARMEFGSNTNGIDLHLTDTNGIPVVGEPLQLAPNGPVLQTDSNGNATTTNAAPGVSELDDIFIVNTYSDTATNIDYENFTVDVVVSNGEPTFVILKKAPSEPETNNVDGNPCNCAPWAGVLGGTIGGVQEVVAGGGSSPGGCNSDGTSSVTITGPGGVNVNLGNGGRRTFAPAADGTWTVTSTVCGKTKTVTITLP